MGKTIDMAGNRYGHWTVLAQAVVSSVGPNGGRTNGSQWRCRCDCGTERVVNGQSLRVGLSTSCGCTKAAAIGAAQRLDLAGQRFGRLVAIACAGSTARGRAKWSVKCDCGNEKVVLLCDLRSGMTTSCGCYFREQKRAALPDLTGRTFHYLTVTALAEDRGNQRRWLCACKCGKETTVPTAKLIGGATRSCGCYKTERMTGPGSPSWDDSITAEERALRARRWRSRQIVAWRQAVYARDGFRCVKCNHHGDLNAHHLDGFDWCIDARYDVDNGASLCVPCHREYHSRYGAKNAKCEDFNDFLTTPTGYVRTTYVAPISADLH